MKKFLLFAIAASTAIFSYGQCNPDYDFGDVGFGVFPDISAGENFDDAIVNEPYADTLHILVPTTAADIDDGLPPVLIDSIKLVSVSLNLGETSYTTEEIGLNFLCNNSGLAEDPCTMLGGQQGCGTIFGTPTISGLFDVEVNTLIYAVVFGASQALEYSFSDITFLIEGGVNVQEISTVNFDIAQNKPNPFNSSSSIDFELKNGGEVTFSILNLVGEVVEQRKVNGKRGVNTIRLEASDYTPGVYLYKLEHGSFVSTYRMVVSR